MDASQLPNVSGQLVTAHNPASTDLLGMDHARCAALHNYLVHYAWVAQGREPAILHSNTTNTFFTIHGATADALRSRLDPSLTAFLTTALIPPPNTPEPPPFFFWASEVSNPDDIFANWAADLFDQPEDSLVSLYFPNVGQGGEFGGGVVYHQGCHLAAVFMHMNDYDYALPIEKHPELWHPLETILSNWIDLIHLGKITASPRDVPAEFGSEKIGPWEWKPYSEAQVATCVDSWDRLCDSIEARIALLPATDIAIDAAEPEQLVTPTVLDAVSVPENCFARSFLTRARRPQFHYIAPGLILPSADAPEFAATQPFTNLLRGPQAIPPVCLFPAASSESEVDLTGPLNPFCNDFRTGSADSSVPSRVPAGVYSESVDRSAFDNAEEGFRLLLPYGFKGDDWDADKGARKSDGSVIERGEVAELFQHGYKPFGGDYYRPQRLERLFDHWCKLVVEGVWSVGPQGVEGGIETFREADTKWKDYVIPPTW
ncbi:hypothetical protein FHL15_001951 [Xylaria flabelliformis]|uniref:Uncharacterized protein n=1 Tax=Xylaria flabelliformis TaxID=2512241 RepID=A0A553IAD3_9PEZI|nr:hypothetical protein FHL15_001951 [Xylaria flabelliformis]